jgi:hypothetical protein
VSPLPGFLGFLRSDLDRSEPHASVAGSELTVAVQHSLNGFHTKPVTVSTNFVEYHDCSSPVRRNKESRSDLWVAAQVAAAKRAGPDSLCHQVEHIAADALLKIAIKLRWSVGKRWASRARLQALPERLNDCGQCRRNYYSRKKSFRLIKLMAGGALKYIAAIVGVARKGSRAVQLSPTRKVAWPSRFSTLQAPGSSMLMPPQCWCF